MKYYVSLENNFIDIWTLNKRFNSLGGLSAPKLPLDYFLKSPAPPFVAGNVLYTPLQVGVGQGGGVFGFLITKVANKLNLLENHIKLLETDQDFKDADFKLSAQSLKMLKSLAPNSKAFPGYDDNWHIKGFKCRAEDVIKAYAFGYLKLNDSRPLLEAICQSDYNLQQFLGDKRNSMSQVYSNVMEYYTNGEGKSSWGLKYMGQRLTPHFERTNKVLNEDCVIKWRKPNKNSKWPYTLDHHWFESQESAISLQHHTLAALMGNTHRLHKESLFSNLPVFSSINLLEMCRKSVELFFCNIQKILGKHTNEYGRYVGMVNDLDWPNGKFSSRKLTAEVFPVKACLALGVMPTFDASGAFDKFVTIGDKLFNNTKILYYAIDPETFVDRRPDITLLLCYSVGLMSLEQLDLILGPISATSELLKSDSMKINLKLSNNVVCCTPIEAANLKITEILSKQGIVFCANRNASTSFSILSNDKAKEFEESDPLALTQVFKDPAYP